MSIFMPFSICATYLTLTSITVAANQRLKTVRGGRYQLYRRYESSGRALKAGLELDVLDTSNGEKRSVTTLSGGEKFLLASSLAIGLSTVVQAQSGGTRLDAMFIDEGFTVQFHMIQESP